MNTITDETIDWFITLVRRNRQQSANDTKNKPLLEELIKRLDGLSEKRLKNIVDIVNTLIDSYESGEDLR